MTWAKFDDRYDDNRKIKRAFRADPGAVGLHAMAITYCSRHETDGMVDEDWLEERVPRARQREKLLELLVELGLFESNGNGFYVHDYLEYNPSRATLDERRERDREAKRKAGRKGAKARWGNGSGAK